MKEIIVTIFAVILVYIAATLIGNCVYDNTNCPTALDVYKNRTTLEITYRDSIPVDTIVVFKEEFKSKGYDTRRN